MRHLSPSQRAALADQLCDLVRQLTAHRRGAGPHWIMVGEIHARLAEHQVEVSAADLDAAIDICRRRHALRVEGDPVHSISVWTRPLGRKLQE